MAEMVRKESGGAILNHWMLAISCILLIITGFAFLFHLDGVGAVFGGYETMKTVHNWVGVVFGAVPAVHHVPVFRGFTEI